MPTDGCSVHMPIIIVNSKLRGAKQDSVSYEVKVILNHIPDENSITMDSYPKSSALISRKDIHHHIAGNLIAIHTERGLIPDHPAETANNITMSQS